MALRIYQTTKPARAGFSLRLRRPGGEREDASTVLERFVRVWVGFKDLCGGVGSWKAAATPTFNFSINLSLWQDLSVSAKLKDAEPSTRSQAFWGRAFRVY